MPTPVLLCLLLALLLIATMLWLWRLQAPLPDAWRELLLLRQWTLRRNHAIEHATANVLEERHGRCGLVGHATNEGFRIAGAIEPLELLDAAHEALRRLQRGERRLAIYSRCAPSYLAAQLLVGASVLLFLLAARRLVLLDLPLVLAVALVLAPGVSRLLQRFATTAADVQGVGIEGIGPVSQYLRDNLRVSEFSVRIRPLARRSYEPQYQYGRLAPAYATARQRRR
jgi:hypothetical protein